MAVRIVVIARPFFKSGPWISALFSAISRRYASSGPHWRTASKTRFSFVGNHGWNPRPIRRETVLPHSPEEVHSEAHAGGADERLPVCLFAGSLPMLATNIAKFWKALAEPIYRWTAFLSMDFYSRMESP